MSKLRTTYFLALVVAAGAIASYAYTHRVPSAGPVLAVAQPASAPRADPLLSRPDRRAALVGHAEKRRAGSRLSAGLR